MNARLPSSRATALTTAALAVVIAALAVMTVWTSLDASTSTRRANRDLALEVIHQDIQAAVIDEGAAEQAYRDAPSEQARRRFREAQGRLEQAIARLREEGAASDQAIIPYIVADELRFRWAARELFAAVDRRDAATARRIQREQMAPAYDNMRGLAQLSAKVHRERALNATAVVSERSARFAAIVSIAFGAGLVLLALCGLFLVRLQATLRRMASAEHHRARHDALTGLPNRLLWYERIAAALAEDGSVAVLLVDLDGFKDVNDRLGHHEGDALLRVVGDRLARMVRPGDTVGRLGGDEFAVLLPAAGAREAYAVAEHLSAALDEPCVLAGETLHPSGSIGVAVAPEHGRDAHALLRHADLAMYRAKSARRPGERPARAENVVALPSGRA